MGLLSLSSRGDPISAQSHILGIILCSGESKEMVLAYVEFIKKSSWGDRPSTGEKFNNTHIHTQITYKPLQVAHD